MACCLLALGACAPADGAGLPEIALRPAAPAGAGRSIGQLDLVSAHMIVGGSGRKLGGLSSIRLDGDHLLLLSDRGRLFRARRLEDRTGRLVGLRDWTELPLPASVRKADTEALAVLPDGTLVIGAEDRDALFRLDREGGAPTLLPLPASLRDPPLNQGIETLTALPPDGSLLAVSEGVWRGRDRVAAALLFGDRATGLALPAKDGFQPTDAAVAGEVLLLLQRRLSLLGGLEARILALPLADLAEGEAVEIARLDAASFAENFEGIAVRELGPGDYRIYLVADDNFSPLLRSLLLELAWQPPG